MGRIMAIDFGGSRTGLAVTDPLRITANGLATVATPKIFDFIDNYLKAETVDCFVVGDPVSKTYSDIISSMDKFVEKLKNKYPQTEVVRVDERYTSRLAKRAMLEGGLGKKARRNKETVDRVSAVIILQSYLEQLSSG